MSLYNSVLETIGKTPIVKIGKINNTNAVIYAKLEYFNPGGSVKDRAALAMIESAERDGKINKETIIIEPTSGNTGIGLAMVCAVKGYKLILTMPETMSMERRNLLKAYGAELELTTGSEGMSGAIKRAEEIKSENPNSYIPQQFKNQANPEIHRKTTALEIINDLSDIDIFVAGVGTGGTVTGVGEFLKSINPKIKVVAVEPLESPTLSGGKYGLNRIQGIGAGFVPDILNRKIIDEVMTVSNEDAFETTRKLAKIEGILAGISSGASVFAAIELGKREENAGKKIVTIVTDTGERYLTAGVF